jgi:hypothetical protein
MTTPQGKRLIEAVNTKSAINYALRTSVTVKNLNASELANVLRHENIEIESAMVVEAVEAEADE